MNLHAVKFIFIAISNLLVVPLFSLVLLSFNSIQFFIFDS